MAADEIHVGDISTEFILTIKDGSSVVDVSSLTTRQILFKKPNGVLLTKTASVVTDGTDGKISYSTVSGDLDVAGTWKIQGYVSDGDTQGWHSDIQSFRVHRNLE